MKKNLAYILIAVLAISAMLVFYLQNATPGSDVTNGGDEPSAEQPVIKVPEFSKDSAFGFVSKQVGFGTRIPGSASHKACKDWLVTTLKGYGAAVIEQPFDATVYTGKALKATNIVASFNPSSQRRILLCAHWDTRHIADHDPDPAQQGKPILGADDGGSGVGVLLEIARQLQQNPPDIGVDIVLFDAEDHGEGGMNGKAESWCLGSQYWSRNLHVPGYKPEFGILLDMVGGSGARFTKEGTSMQYAGEFVDKVWSRANALGYSSYFVNEATPGIIDDHLFINQITGIRTLDIINRPVDSNTGFPGHWHTQKDDLNAIDRYTLKAVGQTVLSVLFYEAAGAM